MTTQDAEWLRGRTVRAIVRPIAELANGDQPEGELELLELAALLGERVPEAIDHLKTAAARRARIAGHTWQEIGDALGLTAQRAHQIARQSEPTKENPT